MASQRVNECAETDDFAALLDARLDKFLQTREYPKTFCPSEVARSFCASELRMAGATEWRELMPTIRSLAWTRKAAGDLQILQGGQPLADDLRLEDLKGPIRIRRTLQS